MQNAVLYKNVWLTKGSEAYNLYELSKKDPSQLKKLDAHMHQLDKNEKELIDRYSKK